MCVQNEFGNEKYGVLALKNFGSILHSLPLAHSSEGEWVNKKGVSIFLALHHKVIEVKN